VYKQDAPGKQDAESLRVVPDNPDDVVARGQEAWRRLHQEHSWADWVAVGDAIRYGRHLAMLEARTNEPSGPRYQAAFAEWLIAKGFDTIDKATRSRLFDCLKHRIEIETWRETLPLNKRLQLNHPNAVWRAWRKSTISGTETVVARPSPTAKYKEEIVRLEDENHRLRRAGDDLFQSQDTAADIARLLADRLLRLTPSKARQILTLLPELYAERSAETPYDKARPRTPKKRRTIEDFQRDLAARKATATGIQS
jgi:hypothetical protein